MTLQELEIKALMIQGLFEHVLGSALAFVPDGAKRLDAMKVELTGHLTGAAGDLDVDQTRILREQLDGMFIRVAKLRAESLAGRSK